MKFFIAAIALALSVPAFADNSTTSNATAGSTSGAASQSANAQNLRLDSNNQTVSPVGSIGFAAPLSPDGCAGTMAGGVSVKHLGITFGAPKGEINCQENRNIIIGGTLANTFEARGYKDTAMAILLVDLAIWCNKNEDMKRECLRRGLVEDGHLDKHGALVSDK